VNLFWVISNGFGRVRNVLLLLSRLFLLTGSNRETFQMVMNVGRVLWPKEYTLIAYILHDTPTGLSCKYRFIIVTKYMIPLWLNGWVTFRFLGFRASVVTGRPWLRCSLVCDKVIHGFPGSLGFHANVDQLFTTCMSRNTPPPPPGRVGLFQFSRKFTWIRNKSWFCS